MVEFKDLRTGDVVRVRIVWWRRLLLAFIALVLRVPGASPPPRWGRLEKYHTKFRAWDVGRNGKRWLVEERLLERDT